MSNTGAAAATDDGHGDAVPSPGPLSIVRNTVRAAVTTPIFLVTHLIRNRHVERSVEHVTSLSEPPPPRTAAVDADALQPASDGTGPLVMRSYSVRIIDPALDASELIRHLVGDPNTVNAGSIAGFVLDDHPVTDLAEGDRIVVELPGPWNGPVVVEHADEERLILATLDGHMEAGRIRFDTTADDDGTDARDGYVFRITSWARAGDRGFEFLHLVVPIGREMQTAMWVAMCRKAAAEAGGQVGRIRVRTEILEGSDDR